MAKYIKICMKCKNSCKQFADLGIIMIKCPSFEPKNQPLANSKADPILGVGGAMKTKSR